MATNAYFQPYEYYENGTIVGIDVDVATAICDTLGMTLKVEDMEFDSIITQYLPVKPMSVCRYDRYTGTSEKY